MSDPELAALLEQAVRNLDALELLMRAAGQDVEEFEHLRTRLELLKRAYTRETDAITRTVLARAVERRVRRDRRRQVEMQTT